MRWPLPSDHNLAREQAQYFFLPVAPSSSRHLPCRVLTSWSWALLTSRSFYYQRWPKFYILEGAHNQRYAHEHWWISSLDHLGWTRRWDCICSKLEEFFSVRERECLILPLRYYMRKQIPIFLSNMEYWHPSE